MHHNQIEETCKLKHQLINIKGQERRSSRLSLNKKIRRKKGEPKCHVGLPPLGFFLFCCIPVNSDTLGSGGGGGRDPPGPKQSRNNYFGRGDNLHLRMLVPGMRTPLDGWRTHRRDELGFCRRNQSKSIQGYTNHRLYEYKRAQNLGCINTPGFFKRVFPTIFTSNWCGTKLLLIHITKFTFSVFFK